MQPSAVPTTTYAILGLLTFGESSGYDLAKLAERSVGHFWSPAKSQIYAELRRLVDLGYATHRRVEQTERPDKRLYRITPGGEDALRAWLNRPDVEPESIKSPFLLKLFFGHLADPAALRAQVARLEEETRSFLAELREIERRIADRPELLFPYLTLRSGQLHGRASLRWVREVRRRIEEREGARG